MLNYPRCRAGQTIASSSALALRSERDITAGTCLLIPPSSRIAKKYILVRDDGRVPNLHNLLPAIPRKIWDRENKLFFRCLIQFLVSQPLQDKSTGELYETDTYVHVMYMHTFYIGRTPQMRVMQGRLPRIDDAQRRRLSMDNTTDSNRCVKCGSYS
ncbi:uncharacterized protein BDCG_17948 [Blastomyces dermatitidis ER-3]|uniref:Uncharacterized protein n=1 Tax=Ajellomyces dermatitidis (strain ER-3 / ATCC MYA-2586) TaxID=559297 RepID=A0ABX2W194_AJEDR|nr:uncharacterized protein BDCG_17948 [Blastomyces dermatitidis ER-3]OAT03147.1 hypothetical protein BDCG_17948 [Blastomyces dermatitidis ER-3]